MAAMLPLAQDDDQVRPADLRQAVGDDEGGASPRGGGDGALDLVFGGAVDGAGRIVQDQDARIGQEGARQRQALALPAGERDAALADDGVVALRRKLRMNSSAWAAIAAAFDLVRVGARFAKGDILADRAREQEDILLDDGDLRAQRGQVPVAHIHAIHQDLTRGDVVGAVDQLHQRGLARAGLPDDGHRLPGLHLEGDALQHGGPPSWLSSVSG